SLNKKNQGIIAFISYYHYISLDYLISRQPQRKFPLFVILDSIQDPHNFGAILRTCAALKVDGIIISTENQVAVTSAVINVSAGGIAYVPICQVNLKEVINELKKRDYKP